MHPIQRRYFAEDLVRQRRSDEQRRYLACQQTARIDPNPHQIDAVVFALGRIPEGGCILADEVGLGKTIEAGLVISQLLAEGARRILLLAPKPLVGQWRQELASLFGLEAREGAIRPGAFAGEGIFLAGRELVTGEKGLELLRQQEPFDLCVVDEAHEIFAGLYKRFDNAGNYNADSPHSAMAGRLRDLLWLHGTPVLLLTATPIQNTLLELWGLVQYVDRSRTLLGNLNTFREVFCEDNGRVLASGQEHELRARMNTVVKRTLRRQAEEFLERPFTKRHAELFEYAMSAAEKSLYDDVSEYLLEPELCAFRGKSRRLLLVGFHRLMASSNRALARALDKVAARLRGEKTPDPDLEIEDDDEAEVEETPLTGQARAEMQRVEALAARAWALPFDSKAQTLVQAVQELDKVVIFTEYIATQDYLREVLLQAGLSDEEITLFRPDPSMPRVREALQKWRASSQYSAQVSPDIAARLALVYEFSQTPSRVFLSTESGAKGLNLQFCAHVINYDLPWNPQRIEQRIGRCHRYGQKRDVTVINFLDQGNETQRLLLEILTTKLDLFGAVLGASDQVLQSGDLAVTVGSDLESRLRKIFERARSVEERDEEIRVLSAELGERRKQCEEAQQRAVGVIQSRLDESIRPVFRRIQSEIKGEMAALQRDLKRVVGGLAETEEPLRLGHPLVVAALQEARTCTEGKSFAVSIQAGDGLPRGRGRFLLGKVRYEGFEPTERLLPLFLLEGLDDALELEQAVQLLQLPMREVEPLGVSVPREEAEESLELLLFRANQDVQLREEARFQAAQEQLDGYMEDRLMLQRRRLKSLELKLAEVHEEYNAAVGSEQRTKLEKSIEKLFKEQTKVGEDVGRLQRRDDEDYQRLRAGNLERRYRSPILQILVEAEVTIQ